MVAGARLQSISVSPVFEVPTRNAEFSSADPAEDLTHHDPYSPRLGSLKRR
jgi:hypothetical protein